MHKSLSGLLLLVLAAPPALANDSTAELATGGLVFVRNDDVEMRSEDLFISTREIRVRYRFFNKSGRDVTSLVAFPMPEIKLEGPDDEIAVPTQDPQNILDFVTTTNGRRVAARVEQKALAQGVDRTELLRRLGIPLAPHLASTYEALDRLPPDRRDELLRLGMVESVESDVGKGMQKHLTPRWALQTTYYWDQTFPAGAEVLVEHRYKPSVGGSVETGLGAPRAATEEWFQQYKRKYCLDAEFLHAVDRSRASSKSTFAAPLAEARVEYILRTGANWAGPIKDFRLVVDKGDPRSLVSFCGQNVKKIAPTRFEMRKRDFTPEGDLTVLILQRQPSQ